MDKKKKFDLNLEIFRDLFQICPRVHGQNFDEPPTDELLCLYSKNLVIMRISRVTPPKKPQKFKKPTSLKLTTVLVSPEEPIRKSERVKRPTKKSTNVPAAGAGRDEDDSNNDHESSIKGNDQESDSGDNNTQSDNEKGSNSEHETNENETGSESDQEENEEEVKDDEEEKDDEFVKSPSNSTDDKDETNVESKVENKAEGDEDKGMDYTTSQFNDDVVVRLNKLVNTDEGFIQKEGTDAEMINVQQGNENLEITLNQVIEDDRVTISTATKKTKVPVTSFPFIQLGI
nr:hypothetical protein [Tanacetum cinerariifolium]